MEGRDQIMNGVNKNIGSQRRHKPSLNHLVNLIENCVKTVRWETDILCAKLIEQVN